MYFTHLIQKYFDGNISLKEQIELSDFLADPANCDAEEILYSHWKSQFETGPIPDKDFKPLLDQVHKRIRLKEHVQSGSKPWLQTFQKIAAILIIPLLFSFLAFLYLKSGGTKPNDIVSYAEIQCPLGVRTKFVLPDGSTGFLNSGSRLKYAPQFKLDRRVELSGEAFFDVVHNEQLPFHVNTRNLDIKVLGTTFNVLANKEEETEEIVLQTGKVNVSSKSGEQLANLLPNEQLTLNTDKLTFSKKEVVASQYTTWKEGKLVFRNENMQQVARRLSRWYNADVVVDDRILDSYTFHATFIDEPLDEVLKMISITSPITYSEERRTKDKEGIYLKRKIVLRINESKINQFK